MDDSSGSDDDDDDDDDDHSTTTDDAMILGEMLTWSASGWGTVPTYRDQLLLELEQACDNGDGVYDYRDFTDWDIIMRGSFGCRTQGGEW